jgi:hypothetical protein
MNAKTLNRIMNRIMELNLHVLPVAATMLILAGTLSARASPIAYEGFIYADESWLSGENGGYGWKVNLQGQMTAWTSSYSASTRVATNRSPGLTYSYYPPEGALAQCGNKVVTQDGFQAIMLVEFDLSVAVQSKLEGEAGAGLTVLGVGGKGEISSSIDQTRVQRIKFQVPIAFTPHAHENTG